MNSKFLTFINPYLEYIDKGNFFRKPFKVLYGVFAILSLVLPLIMLVGAINNGIFSSPWKPLMAFLLLWIILAFAYWLIFQIWWTRKDQVGSNDNESDEFVATPVFSHFIQTSGETFGTFIAIVGFGTSLVSFLFGKTSFSYEIDRAIGANFGLVGLIIFPILGFIIIVFSRFIAEQIKALATIANNTKK